MFIVSPDVRLKMFFLNKAFGYKYLSLQDYVSVFDKFYSKPVTDKQGAMDYLIEFAMFYDFPLYESHVPTLPLSAHVRSLSADNRLFSVAELNSCLNISNADELLLQYGAFRFIPINKKEQLYLPENRLHDFIRWMRSRTINMRDETGFLLRKSKKQLSEFCATEKQSVDKKAKIFNEEPELRQIINTFAKQLKDYFLNQVRRK